jgi:copper chaperone
VTKALTIGFAIVASLALISTNSYACGESKASKSASCGSKATATTASAKETPSTASASVCPYSKGASATSQLTAEDYIKQCNYEGKCQYTAVSIKGMTCGGCERSVTTALSKVPGVVKVCSVSYKEGMAGVCFDPTKTSGEALTKAVANVGYEAAIIPAVARTTDSEAPAQLTGCKASCSAHETAKVKTEGDGSK